jgi:hypothetical protein
MNIRNELPGTIPWDCQWTASAASRICWGCRVVCALSVLSGKYLKKKIRHAGVMNRGQCALACSAGATCCIGTTEGRNVARVMNVASHLSIMGAGVT